jgi:hypothetical protein
VEITSCKRKGGGGELHTGDEEVRGNAGKEERRKGYRDKK